MLITKYCTPDARQHILSGNFKIGSLSEYRSSEAGGGLMADRGEGMGEIGLAGNSLIRSGRFGSFNFSNVGLSGDRPFFTQGFSIDAHVYCTSVGGYNRDTHMNIRNGTRSYCANPNYKSFIVLDLDYLIKAFEEIKYSMNKDDTNIYNGEVRYCSREKVIRSENSNVNSSGNDVEMHMKDIIFIKQDIFQVENEYRISIFSINNDKLLKSVYTRDMSEYIQKLFVRSIVDKGANLE
ncbi:hypothetical protein C8N35_101817 [Breoghania corrubedonensis]|uniref:Uncharacterized protein n=1 Tax=Breoghania corrubedonensis TaxID=665038 RepID=A0A2T5VG84_9HYPH|nr:hypothetical protein [Breoghania corrubedonensis]PTW62769.1 hypothetical protein C8N35_101817 [Breoghania corrubedonensis]